MDCAFLASWVILAVSKEPVISFIYGGPTWLFAVSLLFCRWVCSRLQQKLGRLSQDAEILVCHVVLWVFVFLYGVREEGGGTIRFVGLKDFWREVQTAVFILFWTMRIHREENTFVAYMGVDVGCPSYTSKTIPQKTLSLAYFPLLCSKLLLFIGSGSEMV